MQEIKLNGESMNIVEDNIEKLKTIFPDVFTEDKIDFEKLQSVLGDYIEKEDERYNFTWNGKQKALRLAQTPSTGTLRPCKADSKDWDTTENLYIEGDNLEVLKLLQKSYHNKIKMIYIDPPYNTGNDFVYADDFKDNLENYKKITGQIDEEGNKISSNSESDGRYHTNWLNMMYPRLRLARNLLSNDGVIFISIDDNEVNNLRKICDEVFGEDNFQVIFPRVTKKGGKSSDVTAKNHDYILMYCKNKNNSDLVGISHIDSGYSNKDEFFETRGFYKVNQTLDYDSLGYVKSLDYPIDINGNVFYAGGSKDVYLERQSGRHGRADWGWRWRWSKDLYEFGKNNGFIEVKTGGARPRIYTKTYQNVKIENINGEYQIVNFDRTKPLSTIEFTENKYSNDNATKVIDQLIGKGIFEYTKPPELIYQLSILVNKKDFSILDFFSGSATTAHAVMQLNSEDGGNRKYICVQLPEKTDEKSEAFKAGYKNICEIGKERIRRAGEKIKKEVEEENVRHTEQSEVSQKSLLEDSSATPQNDVKKVPDIGFKVFKLDTSNIKKWDGNSDNIEKELQTSIFNYVEDRSELDIVYEIMLKCGLDLTYPIEEIKVSDKMLYSIGSGAMFVCMNNEITQDIADKIVEIKEQKDIEEPVVVFKDNGFKDDATKTNIKETLRVAQIKDFITV